MPVVIDVAPDTGPSFLAQKNFKFFVRNHAIATMEKAYTSWSSTKDVCQSCILGKRREEGLRELEARRELLSCELRRRRAVYRRVMAYRYTCSFRGQLTQSKQSPEEFVCCSLVGGFFCTGVFVSLASTLAHHASFAMGSDSVEFVSVDAKAREANSARKTTVPTIYYFRPNGHNDV